MSRRILVLLHVALALVLVSACSGGGSDEPEKADFDGGQTLRKAAAAMAQIKSVAFTLATENKPPIMVKGGDMRLLRNGDAQGTLTIEQSGQNVEMKVVALGSSIYLNAGTGGWRKAPKFLAAAMYDPSAVLDPQRGISKLLTSVQAPKAETTEKVNGKEAYRVAAKLPKEQISSLLPGIDSDIDGQVWVGRADNRLLKVRGNFPGGKGTVIINFTEFDAPYKIAAPK